jgi:hypothetical protein
MMPPPELPLELLLMIAHHIRDDYGELRYGDFNSFLQVNRALYTCLNRALWQEAGEHSFGTQRVLTHLIKTNNAEGLSFFLSLGGVDVEARLPAFDMTHLSGDEVGAELELEPIPLLIVADLDNVPLARLLLEKGAAKVQYFDRFDNGKFSPLHAARSAEMVQLLLEHNADPDLDDDNERRPLHWYAIRDNIAAMRALLQHGAEVDPVGPYEKPLHEAAQRNLDAVKLLVEHGADGRARDLQQNTPLHMAAAEGKTDVVKFLVEQWPESMRYRNECLATPLHWAAAEGKTDVVKFFVERWPEGVAEGDDCANTPLHHAVYHALWYHDAIAYSRNEVVGLLVESRPEAIRIKNQFGDTPLQLLLWCEESLKRTDKRPLDDEKREEIVALLGGP